MYLAEIFGDGGMKNLDEDMKAKLQEWETLLCVPAVDSVDKFMQILDRRKVELPILWRSKC